MNTIRLSICIATFNRAAFIGATLESIIPQANEAVEIVVLDGASTDNTGDIVRSYQDRFPRLRYFRQDANKGVDHDFSEAVALARGEYCWLFSDDDLLKPAAVDAVLEAIRGAYGLIIANAEVLTADLSKVLWPNRLSLRESRVYKSTDGQRFFTEVANYLTFIGCVIIKRALWSAREKEKYFGSYFIHAGVIFQAPLSEDVLAIAQPLISIRYGNAMWLARYFEIWMFKWPELLWSFKDYPDSVKLQVYPKEPWRSGKTLLLHRAKGAYSIGGYRKWLKPRLNSTWSRTVSAMIAYLPGSLTNLLAVAYYTYCYHRPDRSLILVDLKNSPFWPLKLNGRQNAQSCDAGSISCVSSGVPSVPLGGRST